MLLATLLLAGCASLGGGFEPKQLAKSDLDRYADVHRREIFASLRLLGDKLYKRNPREWQKGGQPAAEAALNRVFEQRLAWHYAEFDGRQGTDLVALALHADFRGDRVAAFVGGLGGMLHAAFGGKTEFFLLDDLDPQRLHDAARNLEIAAWRLATVREADGRPRLLSNELLPPPQPNNLSFEREFGKMIANLDTLSQVAAEKSQRGIARVAQSLATSVFLPIPGLK